MASLPVPRPGFNLSQTLLNVGLAAAILLLVGAIFLGPHISHVLWHHQHDAEYGCRSNLSQLEGAKIMWASEHGKLSTDTPQETDLFGRDKYITAKTSCPAGGVYNLGAVNRLPACSKHGEFHREHPR